MSQRRLAFPSLSLALFALCATLFAGLALTLTACTGNACLELAQQRCECCAAERIEDCKLAMEQQHTQHASSDLENQRCEDDAKTYRGCQDVTPQTLGQICALMPTR